MGPIPESQYTHVDAHVNTSYSQPMTPKKLLKIYGSQSEIARALGVTRQAVLRWFKTNKIPALRLYQIECVLKLREGA